MRFNFFYECENYNTKLILKKGDCCVFCGYGTELSPSKQGEKIVIINRMNKGKDVNEKNGIDKNHISK